MTFAIKIDQDAIRDIEEAIVWYESQQLELSNKVFIHFEKHIYQPLNPHAKTQLNFPFLPLPPFPPLHPS
jgi:hypothetical protein